MKLIFATMNRHKLRELREILGPLARELLCLHDLPEPLDVEETGETFADNARIKALEVMRATGLPAIADDSGLEVDALGGRPGVHSARYAGPDATNAERIAKLLGELRGVPPERRSARFRCAIAFVHPDDPDRIEVCESPSCEGRILEAQRGEGGFGYDPVFYAEELGQTFAEASAGEKNRLSHRGRAMRMMAELLGRRLG